MELWWAKADRGLYYLRDKPGGRGPSVGRVWSATAEGNGATRYHAIYDTEECVINFTERGQPKTVMAMLEEQIAKRFPGTMFTKEGF